MSKQKSTALVLVITIVVLATTALSLLLTREDAQQVQSEEDSAFSMQEINLVEKDVGDIEQIHVENAAGGFVVKPTEPGVESYQIEGLEALDINVSTVKSMVFSSFQIISADPVGVGDDLSDYGLTAPQASVTTTFLDGTEFSYYVGDTTYSDDTARYTCAKGSNYVYIVNCDEHLLKNGASFLQNTVLSLTSDSEGESAGVEEISISGAAHTNPIVLKKEGDGYQMTQPVRSACADGIVQNLAYSVTNVFGTAVEANPSEETLQEYGLAKPLAVVRFVFEGTTYQLSAAQKDEETYYLMREGVPVIYEVSAEDVDAWATTTPLAVRDKQLTAASVQTVRQLTVKTEQESVSFSISRQKDEEKSTEDVPAYRYTIKAHGKRVDEEDYQSAMETLSAVSLVGETDKKASGEPDLLLIYTTFDNEKHTLKFYALDEERYAVLSDGQNFGLVERDEMDSVVNRLIDLQK